MIERGRQISTSLPGRDNGVGDDNGGDEDEDMVDSDSDNDTNTDFDSNEVEVEDGNENCIDIGDDDDDDADKHIFSTASSAAAMRSRKSKGIEDPSTDDDGHLPVPSSTCYANQPQLPPPDDVLQQSAPREHFIVPVLEQPPQEPEVAVEGTRRVRQRLGPTSQKVFTSPAILNCISPLPHCAITLNVNDHRWSSKWKSGIHCDSWLGPLRNQSKSKTFVSTNEASWKTALRDVHTTVWKKFHLHGNLEISIPPQEPGKIPDAVFTELSLTVANLPAAKSYHA